MDQETQTIDNLFQYNQALVKNQIGVGYRQVIDAEQLALDVVIELLENIARDARFEDRFAIDPVYWCRTIARSRVRDEIRRVNRKRRAGDKDTCSLQLVDNGIVHAEGNNPAAIVERKELVKKVYSILSPIESQVARSLRDGNSIPETAVKIDRTESTVRKIQSRIETKARKICECAKRSEPQNLRTSEPQKKSDKKRKYLIFMDRILDF